MTLRRQITLLLGLVAVMLAAMLSTLVVAFESANRVQQQAETSEHLSTSIAQLRFVLIETMLYRESRPREQWSSKIASMHAEIDAISYDDPRRNAMLRRIRGNLSALDSLYTRLLRFGPVFAQDENQSQVLRQSVATTASALLSVTQEMLDDGGDLASRSRNDARQAQRAAIFVSIAWVLVVLISTIVIFRKIRTRVLRPVADLQNGAERIKAGDFDVRLGIEGHDEIAQLGRAFDDMARQVQKHQLALAREVLQSRHAQLKVQAIIEHAPYAILTLDQNGLIDNGNLVAEKLFGYSVQELCGKNVRDLIEEWEYWSTNRMHSVDEKPSARARNRAGQLFEVELATARIDTEYAHIMVVMAQDVSERVRAQEKMDRYTRELSRSNKELAEFAYIASHDLKSPLHGIDQLATWVCEDVGDKLPAESLEHLQMMRARIRRMEALLNDLLAYSRAGHLAAEFSAVDSEQLVRDIFDLFAAKHISLAFETAMPTLVTLKAPLQMIFRNLIGNAIKHHDRVSGNIWVGADRHGEGWLFWVRDDGPGIDPKYHERVFELFQTLRPRDEVEGSGMGLSVVKKSVERVGGSVSLISDGRGAKFSFIWPSENEIRRVLHAQ